MVEHVAGHVEGSGVAVVQADPVKKPNGKGVQYLGYSEIEGPQKIPT
jgi:hypothetical protein